MADACDAVPADPRFFEVHCRGVLVDQTELHSECFPQQFVNLFKEVEVQLDPTSTKDGASFSALRATFWSHTNEAKVPSKEVLDGSGEFHATYGDEDVVIQNTHVAPQVSSYLPMRDFIMEGCDRRFGYVIGFVTLNNDWVALKRVILHVEQLLRFAMCRIQRRGHHRADIMQAVAYCFIGSPDFPKKRGKESREGNARCVGNFIKKHKEALPLCSRMWEHGAFLYMRNPGGTKKPTHIKRPVYSEREEATCGESCAQTEQQLQDASNTSEAQCQSRLPEEDPSIDTGDRHPDEIVLEEKLKRTQAKTKAIYDKIEDAIYQCDIDAYLSFKLELQSVWNLQDNLELEFLKYW
ncbi:hypothetical protein COCOBI_06-5280 [Coccomyxa sp. Obi]|nr:hypothetical protein COCOBI_06-5280 [Coccomyxa sp. Obi]